MRSSLWAVTVLLFGCGSSTQASTLEATIPTLTVASTAEPAERAPAETETAEPSLPPAEASPTNDADVATAPLPDGADICAIDPDVCKPMSPELVKSCRCNRLKGRDEQKCLIDCVARERSRVNQELKQLGP